MSNSFVKFFRSIYVYGYFAYICVWSSCPLLVSSEVRKVGGHLLKLQFIDGYEPPTIGVLGIEPGPLEEQLVP